MFLLLALLLFQTGPPQPVGVVAGLVRGADAKPAVGTRVYAIALRDAAEAAAGPTVFESLGQTDESGRYTLEVPPGRYLIASGSVATPTYYPGTTDVAQARPITVGAGGRVSNIDISGSLPPQPGGGNIYAAALAIYNISRPPAPMVATLGGTIRHQDGFPARGMEVLLLPVPSSARIQLSVRNIQSGAVQRSRSDDSGQYRFVNVGINKYYIMTGTKDVQTFYPGVADLTKATPIEIMPGQTPASMDFVVAGVSLSGRVTASGGVPAIGTRIKVRLLTLAQDEAGPGSFMPKVLLWESAVSSADGSYSVGGLPPGSYTVEATIGDVPPQTLSVNVGDQPVKSADLRLPVVTVSGNILFEDGTPLRDARGVGNIVLTTVGGPDASEFSVLKVNSTGTFGNLTEPGEYKVTLPSLGPGYVIKSITAGKLDLLKETLKVTDTTSISLEIRLEK